MRNSSYVPSSPRRGAWWRSKPVVALTSALVGLIAGLSMSGASNSDALSHKVDALSQQRSDLKAQVLQLKDSAIDQTEVDQQVADAVDEAQTEAAAAQKEAVDKAVHEAVTKERARAARLVAAAKKTAARKSSSSSSSSSSSGSSSGGGTDPRFGTCAEANDAGYGPYREGVDPEYDWYQDRDGDGVDCEP